MTTTTNNKLGWKKGRPRSPRNRKKISDVWLRRITDTPPEGNRFNLKLTGAERSLLNNLAISEGVSPGLVLRRALACRAMERLSGDELKKAYGA